MIVTVMAHNGPFGDSNPRADQITIVAGPLCWVHNLFYGAGAFNTWDKFLPGVDVTKTVLNMSEIRVREASCGTD